MKNTSSKKNNIHVLIDAKKEYTNQLKNTLTVHIYQGFQQIYIDAKKSCLNKKQTDGILKKFQKFLSTIPKWNETTITEETERIKEKAACDWLDLLITAVFVTHSKVLISVKNQSQNYNDIQLDIPSSTTFIHKCYIEAARNIWKHPYLFYDEDISNYDYQRNIRDIEKIINIAIEETVRQLLPVKHILKEYLGNNFTSSLNKDEDIQSTVSKMTVNNLKRAVAKELDQIQELEDNTVLKKTQSDDPDTMSLYKIPYKQRILNVI